MKTTRQRRTRWAIVLLLMALLLATGYYFASRYALPAYHKYRASQARMELFDEPAEVQAIAGIHLPDYRVTAYDETDIPDDLLQRHNCHLNGEFKELPPEEFYERLDSLCAIDSLHWRSGGGIYAYDSLYEVGELSKLVLSVVLTKGERAFEIVYDDCIDFFAVTDTIRILP